MQSLHRQTGVTETDVSAVRASFDPSVQSLNKHQGPTIGEDDDAIGNFHRSVVTRQRLDE